MAILLLPSNPRYRRVVPNGIRALLKLNFSHISDYFASVVIRLFILG
jgi:hypothetical protein